MSIGSDLAKQAKRALAADSKDYSQFDRNNDGQLSPDEWDAYLAKYHQAFPGADIASMKDQIPSPGEIAKNHADAQYATDSANSGGLFDPGADSRNRSAYNENLAIGDWSTLGTQMPSANDLYIDPNQLTHYQQGAPLDYTSAAKALDDAGSHYLNQDSAVAGTQIDPTGRNAQTGAIDYHDQLINNNGHDAVSDAQYENDRSQAEQAARAQREAALQDLDERGMGGGTNDLLAELMSARDVGNDTNKSALGVAATAQARRDAAAKSLDTAGSGLYSQDSANAFQKSQGQQDWNQVVGDWWSTLGAKQSELAGDQAAKQWDRANTTADSNVTADRNTELYNAGLPQQVFENKANVVAGKTGQYSDAAHNYLDIAKSTPNVPLEAAGFASNVISNVGKTLATKRGK